MQFSAFRVGIQDAVNGFPTIRQLKVMPIYSDCQNHAAINAAGRDRSKEPRDKKNGQLMLRNHDGQEKYGQLFYRHNCISN